VGRASLGVAEHWITKRGSRVFSKHSICGRDREMVFERLRRQQTIERIAMVKRQISDSNNIRKSATL
jgi:hypothetical protein